MFQRSKAEPLLNSKRSNWSFLQAFENGLIWNHPIEESFSASVARNARVTWTIQAGALPEGLSLSPGGELKGTPRELGEFSLLIRAEDELGREGALSVVLTVESRSWAAYVISDGATGMHSLYLVDLAAPLPFRVELATGEKYDFRERLSFSPDGESFFFLDATEHVDRCELFAVDLRDAAPSPQKVGDDHFSCSPMKWSPDGHSGATTQILSEPGASPESRRPVVIRSGGGEPRLVPAALQQADVTGGISSWLGNDHLLVNPDHTSLLVYDVIDDALNNPRTLGAATSSLYHNAEEMRFVGSSASSREAVDVDDAWTASFDTRFLPSNETHYAYTTSAGQLEEVYSIESLRLQEPMPIRTLQEPFTAPIRGTSVWFVGDRERYLASVEYPPEGGRRFWEVDLEGDEPVRSFEIPDGCFATRVAETKLFTCRPYETRKLYAHVVGEFDRWVEVHPQFDVLDTTGEVVPSHNQQSFLTTLTREDPGATGLYLVEIERKEELSEPLLVSPLDEIDASEVLSANAQWTGDGMFVVYSMRREVDGELFSSAVWKTRTGRPPSPENVSQTNTHCHDDSGSVDGHSCLRVVEIATQPAPRR